MCFSLHFLFSIQKKIQISRTWCIIKSNSATFSPNTFFSRVNNQKVTKRGSVNEDSSSQIEKVSIVILTGIIQWPTYRPQSAIQNERGLVFSFLSRQFMVLQKWHYLFQNVSPPTLYNLGCWNKQHFCKINYFNFRAPLA